MKKKCKMKWLSASMYIWIFFSEKEAKKIKMLKNKKKSKRKIQEVTRECGHLKFMVPRSKKFAGSFIVPTYTLENSSGLSRKF